VIPIAFFAGVASGFTKVRWWIVPLGAFVWIVALVATEITAAEAAVPAANIPPLTEP